VDLLERRLDGRVADVPDGTVVHGPFQVVSLALRRD